MCGIVGIINPTGKYVKEVPDLFRSLLQVGAIRGPHSTGMFKANGKQVGWVKAARPGNEFINMQEFNQTMFGCGQMPFLIGHNRWATHGAINNQNAHPFEHKHICMVHNGTIIRTNKLGKHKDVDSEMIAHAIADDGIEKAAENLHGSFSLVWYNAEDMTLNLLRNKERPMWILNTKENIMVLCSEPKMGDWLAERHELKVTEINPTETLTVYTFKEGEMVPSKTKVPEAVWGSPSLSTFVMGGQSSKAKNKAAAKQAKKANSRITLDKGFYFSINDFDEAKHQGGFIRVFGEEPGKPEVICTGNYSGDIEELGKTKKLMFGIVTNIGYSSKLGKVVVSLKNLQLSSIDDPFFTQHDKPAETPEIIVPSAWDKQQVLPVVAQPQKHKQPAGVLQTRQCNICNHYITRIGGDDPFLRNINGVVQIICQACCINNFAPPYLTKEGVTA